MVIQALEGFSAKGFRCQVIFLTQLLQVLSRIPMTAGGVIDADTYYQTARIGIHNATADDQLTTWLDLEIQADSAEACSLLQRQYSGLCGIETFHPTVSYKTVSGL